jgi:hypothetical protein
LAAIRADLLRRLGRHPEAADAYRMAIELAPTDAERLYLTRRLAETAATDRGRRLFRPRLSIRATAVRRHGERPRHRVSERAQQIGGMPMSATQIVDGVGVPVAGTRSVDPGHREGGVAGRHLGLPRTRGRFSGVDGTVHVADDPTASTIDVTSAIASV